MNKVVLDASALLALIKQENGAEIVAKYLSNSLISSVNISEISSVLAEIGMPLEEITTLIDGLIDEVIDFDQNQAIKAGILRNKTKHLGLSLGDRACINLALTENLPVVTADKAWQDLNIDIEVILIR